MREILNVAWLEFITLKRKIMVVIMLLVGVGFIFSIAFPPQIVSILAGMFTGYIIQPIFSIAEKNSFNRLFGVLPARRRSFVFGRYFLTAVTLLVFMLLFIAIGHIALAWLPFENTEILGEFAYAAKEMQSEEFTVVFGAAIGFFLGCLFILPTFVIDYVFGVSKEAPVSFGFGVFIGVVCVIIDGFFEPDYGNILYHVIKFIVEDRFWTYVILIGGGLLLLAFGAVVSHAFTRKREL